MTGWTHFRRGRHKRNERVFHTRPSLPAKPLLPEDRARQIRLRMQELGPEHSCLALYLSSRIDVLPPEYCHELALTSDSTPSTSPREVLRLLRDELDNQAEHAFERFDYLPETTTFISQQHRARLRTGAPVAVALVRPPFDALENAPETGFWNRAEISDLFDDLLTPDVLADFTATLRRKTNFLLAGEAMELLDRDAASYGLLRRCKPYAELSKNHVLTFQMDEAPLEPVARHQTRTPDVLASRLSHVWLQQALCGGCFPVDPQTNTVCVDENNQVAFLHCDLVSLPESAKRNLLSYFDALLADDPDKAAMYLLCEMVPAQPGVKTDSEGFRSSFRQAAYFGILGPILGTDSNAIAQLAFQHWKTALAHGYTPKPHLLWFYRGLFSMARVTRYVSPSGDPLRKALEELRTTRVFDQVQEIMNWRYWFQSSDKFAAAMINLPRALDGALARASGEHHEILPPTGPGPAPRGLGSSVVSIVMLFVLMLVSHQLLGGHEWLGKIIFLVLMLAGLLILREAFD